MPRQPRIVLPGVPHHVTQRGNDRQDVFFRERDRAVYLQYLRESAVLAGVSVSAYCLMTNHVHLVVTPERENSLSRALARTHLMYTQYVFRTQGRSGHLWQNRFYSCPLDEAHEHSASAYVELNPVRAGMTETPWDYPWSSAAAHCGLGGDASGLLDVDRWFQIYSIESWRETLTAIGESDGTLERIRMHTRSGRPLGDASFIDWVERKLDRPVRLRSRGRPEGSKDRHQRTRRRRRR